MLPKSWYSKEEMRPAKISGVHYSF